MTMPGFNNGALTRLRTPSRCEHDVKTDLENSDSVSYPGLQLAHRKLELTPSRPGDSARCRVVISRRDVFANSGDFAMFTQHWVAIWTSVFTTLDSRDDDGSNSNKQCVSTEKHPSPEGGNEMIPSDKQPYSCLKVEPTEYKT